MSSHSVKELKVSSKEELPDYQQNDIEKHDDDAALEMSKRLDATSVDGVYERKVYIVNRIMNEHIGMGKFQWQLFALSGFGWFVDNVWLQGVAIILPQIKTEFGVEHAQWMTFSLYIGLIIGAALWGIMADVVGRRLSFNITLFLAGVFGIVGGAAPNFVGLGGILAALGIGLGGNLPVDGMLFLEFIPGANQYLLTLLSVFWSIGQLFASLIAWAFIANYSCADNESNVPSVRAENPTYTDCLSANNMGWRYTFYTLGAVTFVLFVLRFLVFRLPESPKYLVAKGRDADAVAVLKEVGRRNGIELGDDIISVAILRSAAGQETSMDSSEEEPPKEGLGALMQDVKNSVSNFKLSNLKPDMSHVTPLFAGSWSLAYNTTVIILLWGIIGLAYPLYNAFLPTYLSQRNVGTESTTYQTYRDYAIISVCGVPGSIIAAWMVDLPRSGRRGAMAFGTAATGAFLFGFTSARNEAGILGFNCAAALTQNIMYGVLYSYTPESFPAPHRGTGDGIAASFNRLTGLMSPIIAIYSTGGPNVPIYVAAALFLVAAAFMLTLRIESQGKTAL